MQHKTRDSAVSYFYQFFNGIVRKSFWYAFPMTNKGVNNFK